MVICEHDNSLIENIEFLKFCDYYIKYVVRAACVNISMQKIHLPPSNNVVKHFHGGTEYLALLHKLWFVSYVLLDIAMEWKGETYLTKYHSNNETRHIICFIITRIINRFKWNIWSLCLVKKINEMCLLPNFQCTVTATLWLV